MSVLRGRVVVLSPHLDDGVFSLGATIRRATRAGAKVEVLTVLAGDPDSEAPAGCWDARSGFRTAGEAARARRAEDEAACRAVGAASRWLPFPDRQYGRPVGDDEAFDAIAGALGGADLVLVPGFPLSNPDHAWLADLVLGRCPSERVGIYVEWPYAYESLRASSTPDLPDRLARAIELSPCAAGIRDTVAKWRALRRYRSQVRHLSAVASARLVLAERRAGGEMIGLPVRDGSDE